MLSNTYSDVFKISHIPHISYIDPLHYNYFYLSFSGKTFNIVYSTIYYILIILYMHYIQLPRKKKNYGTLSIKFKITIFKFPLLLTERFTIYISRFLGYKIYTLN